VGFWDVLASLPRRWYVVLIGVIATVVGILLVQVAEPVYYSRAQVYFLAPASQVNPNTLRVRSLDLVAAAGVVAKTVNGTDGLTGTASPDATLIGRGILDGTAVTLPDNGGQWSVSYDTQALNVEVAARTAAEVRSRQTELFSRIDDALTTLQRDQGVPAANLITTEILPADPFVVPYGGDRRRAQGMILVLGVAGTMLAVGSIELAARRSGAQRGRRARSR